MEHMEMGPTEEGLRQHTTAGLAWVLGLEKRWGEGSKLELDELARQSQVCACSQCPVPASCLSGLPL